MPSQAVNCAEQDHRCQPEWAQKSPLTRFDRAARVRDPVLAQFETEALPHINDLFRTAMHVLRNRSQASDAVQDTFLRAWKAFHRYEPGTNCRAWLFKILFNVVRNERRRWFKWVTGNDDYFAGLPLTAPEPVPTELTDPEILAALDRLGTQFREVLLLVDVQELSYKEVGEILQIPIGTVMSRLSRAREYLRRLLTDTARSPGLAAHCKQLDRRVPMRVRASTYFHQKNAIPIAPSAPRRIGSTTRCSAKVPSEPQAATEALRLRRP